MSDRYAAARWRQDQKWREKNSGKRTEPRKKAKAMDAKEYKEAMREIMSRELSRMTYGISDPRFRVDFGSMPRPQSEADELRQRLDLMTAKLQEQDALLRRLATGASPLADVIQVSGSTTYVSNGGNIIAVTTPETPVSPGDQVKLVAETMQIREKVDAPIGLGEVTTITNAYPDGLCEIMHAGSTRLVVGKLGLEPGDRVVLDRTGQVILRTLASARPAKTRRASITWDSIGGLADAKRELRDAIELPYQQRSLFAKYGQKPAGGVLLHGPPGNGKTLLARAVAGSLAALHGSTEDGFTYVKGPEILSKYVGASEENIRSMFDKARRHKQKHGVPAVIFVDEAESILGTRGASGGSYMDRTIVPQFLAEMDGLDDSGAFVLLATNRPDSLDPAVVRDGRIDRRILVPRPDRETAAAIFRIHLDGKPLATDSDDIISHGVTHLFSETHVLVYVELANGGHRRFTLAHVANGAMIAGVVQRATQTAIHREITGGDGGISTDDIAEAVAQSHREQRDIDQRGALAEFIDTIGHPAVRISKEAPRSHATAN